VEVRLPLEAAVAHLWSVGGVLGCREAVAHNPQTARQEGDYSQEAAARSRDHKLLLANTYDHMDLGGSQAGTRAAQ
jgi:hypothetical protein